MENKKFKTLKLPKLTYRECEPSHREFSQYPFSIFYYPQSNILDKYRVEYHKLHQEFRVYKKTRVCFLVYRWERLYTEKPIKSIKIAEKTMRGDVKL